MRSIHVLLMILLISGCASKDPYPIQPWHVSPNPSPLESNVFVETSWSQVDSLYIGMSKQELIDILGPLNYYQHINVIFYSQNPTDGLQYEIALKLSHKDNSLEAISYKRFEVE